MPIDPTQAHIFGQALQQNGFDRLKQNFMPPANVMPPPLTPEEEMQRKARMLALQQMAQQQQPQMAQLPIQ